MSETVESGPTTNETLLGEGTVHAFHLDGTCEATKVRQLRIRDYPEYLKAIDDEAKAIEVFTGKDAAWVDSLTPNACLEIITEGERINMDFFSQWVQRKLARQEKMVPGLAAKMVSAALQKDQPQAPAAAN